MLAGPRGAVQEVYTCNDWRTRQSQWFFAGRGRILPVTVPERHLQGLQHFGDVLAFAHLIGAAKSVGSSKGKAAGETNDNSRDKCPIDDDNWPLVVENNKHNDDENFCASAS